MKLVYLQSHAIFSYTILRTNVSIGTFIFSVLKYHIGKLGVMIKVPIVASTEIRFPSIVPMYLYTYVGDSDKLLLLCRY